MGATSASDTIKNKLKSAEGLKLAPYQRTYTFNGNSVKDKPTIGYGNTTYENGVSVKLSDPKITKLRADQLFSNIFATYENLTRTAFKGVPLTQNQFDALCHFVYNAGHFGKVFTRVVIAYLRRQLTAKQLFDQWTSTAVYIKRVFSPDLRQRRANEANYFLNSNLPLDKITSTTPILEDPEYTVQENPKPQDAYIVNTKSQSMAEFCKANKILMNPNDLLSYKDNSQSVLRSYKSDKVKQYNGIANTELISEGTKVKVPLKQIDSRSIYVINQTIIYNTNYKTFIDSQIRALINNPKYKKINISGYTDTGSVFKKQDEISVWLWCKTLNNKQFSKGLIDITKFVESISQTQTKDGGNFSITLPFLAYAKDENEDYILAVSDHTDTSSVRSFVSKNSTHRLSNSNQVKLIADNSLIDEDANEINPNGKYWRKNNSYFQNLIQNNDLIFIKQEKILLDEQRESEDDFSLNGYINKLNLPGSIFDMIGLIDSCPEINVAENTTRNSSISGRDLSKLLIEDGTYFFPVEYSAKNSEDIIKNSSRSKSGRRLIIGNSNTNAQGESNIKYAADGSLIGDVQFNFNKTQSIKEWVTFIFSQLTNIEICSSDLFDAYKDKTFIITADYPNENDNSTVYRRVQANGIWTIIKLVIDDSIGNRRLADTSLATETGSLLNLVRKVCQEPFCEFFMDTYGDKYYFIVRKPPFSYESFITNKCINIFEDDIESDSLEFSTEVYSWYKLNPYNSIFGNDDNGAYLTVFPAVMFPEYMEIWGNKVLEISSNYIDFDPSISNLSDDISTNIKNQALEDLDWLIETNAYMPFTRTGTIVMKSDRRIKRGMNVRNYGTGEIFYVDAVSHSKSFAGDDTIATTTLKVSRGMVEEHLDKYFKIINLRKNDPSQKNNLIIPPTSNTWTVNQDIFNFFLRRMQND